MNNFVSVIYIYSSPTYYDGVKYVKKYLQIINAFNERQGHIYSAAY